MRDVTFDEIEAKPIVKQEVLEKFTEKIRELTKEMTIEEKACRHVVDMIWKRYDLENTGGLNRE